MDMEKYLCTRNVLVLGQTGYDKTTFVQNLGKNNMFGKIKDVLLSKERKHQIRFCFYVPAEFFSSQNVIEFNIVIKNFHRKKENTSDNNIFGENNKFDRLIIMDDVSDPADISNDFGSFLTVARKFNFTYKNFLDLYKCLRFLIFYQWSVTDTLLTIYQTEIFGWTDLTLKFQILIKRLFNNWLL